MAAKSTKRDESDADEAAGKAAADPAPGDAARRRRPVVPEHRFTIRSPAAFTGKRCDGRLSFRDGVATTDNPADAAFCRGLGYAVTDHDDDE